MGFPAQWSVISVIILDVNPVMYKEIDDDDNDNGREILRLQVLGLNVAIE